MIDLYSSYKHHNFHILNCSVRMASRCLYKLFLPLFLLLLLHPPALSVAQGLKMDFYQYSCPKAEAIIGSEITKVISRAPSLAGPLLRMHFHDCFVNVCLLGGYRKANLMHIPVYDLDFIHARNCGIGSHQIHRERLILY